MDPFLVHEQALAGPATHILVIGVGAYPHLLGGAGPLSPDHDGMKQLSSPPVSARNLAETLISKFHHPQRPLASLALLLSEAKPADFVNPVTGTHSQPAPATYDAVAAAIQDWKKRGEQDAGNLLVFYFCGHGIAQGSDMSLLLSDYGSSAAPLDQALDFRRFRLAMSRNLPSRQVYFVDACRASSDSLIESFGYAGRVPVKAGQESAAQTPVFYATLSGEDAFGKPDQNSVFTDALLRGLRGAGADDSEGNWRITTTRLKEAIDYYVQQSFEGGAKRAQVPPTDELTTFDLLHLQDEPEVQVLVTCQPDVHNAQAEFVCEAAGVEKGRRPPAAKLWSLPLPAGSYQFRAVFPAGMRAPIQKDAWVRPVYRKVPLEVP